MCITPSFVWIERGPVWEKKPVACRQCWSCRVNRVSDYVGRSLAEASTSDWTVALTLTYAPRDDLRDKHLDRRHFQDFIRSLRDTHHKIRYLAVGEYGKLRGRAHWHCVLFGKGTRPEIPHKENANVFWWPHGYTFADWDADEKALRYVVKYLLKGEKDEYWFSLSKKPALGAEFFAMRAQEYVEARVFPSSFNYLPPAGHRNRPYFLNGASRRDFVRAIADGWQKRWPLDRSRLNEWVALALEKVEFQDAVKLAEGWPLAEQMAGLESDLERGRRSEAYWDRKIALDTSEMES